MARNYKNISVNFNLDNEKDMIIYEWLMSKRAKTAFIKDVLEEYLCGNNVKTETLFNDIDNDDIDDIEI